MAMVCVNRHSNPDGVRFCQTCGSNTFLPGGGPVYAAPAAPGYNGLAIASLVVLVAYIPFLTPIAQIVLGVKAREQIRRTGEQGEGMATAGIVIGIVGIVGSIILVVVLIAIFATVASHVPQPPPQTFPPNP